MKSLLIACCSDKNPDSLLLNNKSINDLSFKSYQQQVTKNQIWTLGKCREFISKKYNENQICYFNKQNRKCSIKKRITTTWQINWQRTAPAYQLYTGNLFSQVDEFNWKNCNCDNWVDCNCNNKVFKILILSPLWGWIKHTDYIPNYNLDMEDLINLNTPEKPNWIKLWRLWAECFKNILQPNTNRPYFDFNDCCDILYRSGMYRPAVQFNQNNEYFNTQNKAKQSLCLNCNGDDAIGHGDQLGKFLDDKLIEIKGINFGNEF